MRQFYESYVYIYTGNDVEREFMKDNESVKKIGINEF